ncbi:tRNA(Cytosine32)-2-thiocytidine synthetase [Lachnospiraceae bacterium KM106-2]|nr:tRNA(Cytosine32)-2-thiocytidine synthetase [Lachnospiraceae bacterium KM106-2]
MLLENKMNTVKEYLLSEYKENIWDICYKTFKEYQLVEENDHIAVSIEGDRNSLLLHACLQIYQELSGVNFTISFILVPNVKVTLEQLMELAREWGIKEYHIVKATTEKEYLDYMRGLGCNKIAVNLNRDSMIKEYMLRLIQYKKFFQVSPMYQMVTHQNYTAIHPFFFVEEKDMVDFSDSCNMQLFPRAERVLDNVYRDSSKSMQLNVYHSV